MWNQKDLTPTVEMVQYQSRGENVMLILTGGKISPTTVRNNSHKLGFLKGLLQTKGRRRPEGEAPSSTAEWAVVASFSSLQPLRVARRGVGLRILDLYLVQSCPKKQGQPRATSALAATA